MVGIVTMSFSCATARLALTKVKANNTVFNGKVNRFDKFELYGVNIIFDPFTDASKFRVLERNFQDYF
jgi:hypothetical protein